MEHFAKNLLNANPSAETKSIVYNNTLFTKGLLLRSTNDVRDAILNSGNQELIAKFTKLQTIRQQITALQSNSDSMLVAYGVQANFFVAGCLLWFLLFVPICVCEWQFLFELVSLIH